MNTSEEIQPPEAQARPDRGPAVVIDSVTVVFTDKEGMSKIVLDDLSLTVESGEFVALVGKSGCGKTTVLNLACGMLVQQSGDVAVLDTAPVDARGRLGFMLARDALLPWRTALRNVEYGLEIRGVDKKERRARAKRYLAMLGLEHAGSLWPWQLSQGMRQRVALARTWALQPELLLMDEPFAALDSQTRAVAHKEFLQLWDNDEESGRRRTVVFVTHDLGEALTLADRVVLLSDGRIADEVRVPFDRPRDPAVLASMPEYHEALARLRSRL